MSITTALIGEKEHEYRQYIDNHKLNVQRAWDNIKNNRMCIKLIKKNFSNMKIDVAIDLIDELIKYHDESKYGEKEFDAYRKEFYPINPSEKENNKEAFDKAWKHHYTNNLHHWDWWYESGNIDNMPFVHVIEMICDWEAMGYQFGNTSKQWYEQNKDKIYLGEKQRRFAEE